MAAYSCLFRNPFPWMVVLGSSLVLAHSSGFGFLTLLLTTSALILCRVIVSCSLSCHQKSELKSESKEGVLCQNLHVSETEIDCSSDALSDSESLDQTTTSSEQDSENDWIFRQNLTHNTLFSDGSISDEDSLIEIALPAGRFVDSKRQDHNHDHDQDQDHSLYRFRQKCPDLSTESHFSQQNWVEVINEMNEEDNLIEIDICMGSIKCSRFEIEA